MKKSKKSFDSTIFTLSHSSLETLEKCPFQWYLKYIELNYPEREAEAADFGSLCHEIAEHYGGEGPAEIKRLFREYHIKYQLTKTYQAKLPTAFRRIHAFVSQKLIHSPKVYREKDFRFPYSPFIDINGKIDVIYQDAQGELVIVDYKTNKDFKDHSKQFEFYYYMLSKLKKNLPKKIRFEAVYLSAGKSDLIEDFVVPQVLDEEAIEKAIKRIDSGLEMILDKGVEKENWEKKPQHLCNWCDYGRLLICDRKCSN